MNLLETIFALELEGTESATRVWQSCCYDNAIHFDVITDDEAERERVRWATVALTSTDSLVWIIDRIPLAPRLVQCGGLKSIEPSVGGDLKNWMLARVARLWRGRGGTLFSYVTKRSRPLRTFDRASGAQFVVADWNVIRKKQRWETRDYVDLAVGDSPAHLSGFGKSGSGDEMNMRGVSAPRGDPPQVEPLSLHNESFNFGGSR